MIAICYFYTATLFSLVMVKSQKRQHAVIQTSKAPWEDEIQFRDEMVQIFRVLGSGKMMSDGFRCLQSSSFPFVPIGLDAPIFSGLSGNNQLGPQLFTLLVVVSTMLGTVHSLRFRI